jgi:hypothetical protein
MAQDRDAGTLIDSLDEFRALVIEKFREKLRRSERRAVDTGRTIVREFTIGAEHLAEPLLRIRYVCEPGRAARVLTVRGPRDCSALFSPTGRHGGHLH